MEKMLQLHFVHKIVGVPIQKWGFVWYIFLNTFISIKGWMFRFFSAIKLIHQMVIF